MDPGAPAPLAEVEVEWQFDALDLRPVERWLSTSLPASAMPFTPEQPDAVSPRFAVRPRPAKRLADTYMDTADWRLTRAGYVLRVRRRDQRPAGTATATATADVSASGTGELTLKNRVAATGGLRRRLEVTEALPEAGVAAVGPDGPVGRRLHALGGTRPLDALFVVRTRRRPFTLLADDEPVGEVALDDTVIDVPESTRPVRMQRVEVEVDPAWEERVAPLVARLRIDCGLQPAAVSKFEAGLLGSGLTVPSGPDVGPTVLPPAPTVAELAFVVLRRNLGQMLAHEPGTRLGEDPEDLHDMRVATRRMRAALDLFAEVLPARARGIRAELGWVADALGRVRDLDVQLERVEQFSAAAVPGSTNALKDLGELLHQRRHEARTALLASLESARYERLVASFSAMLSHGPLRRPGPGNAPALLAVPELVRSRHRAVAKAAKKARRSGELDDFHKLRIRGKRLRYAVEFVTELYGSPAKKYVKCVQRLQDALGSMQDARVAAEQLHALAVEDDDGLSRETVFVLGGLAERFRQESTTLAARVPRRLAELSGSRWHQLTDALDRRRLEVAQLAGWPGFRTRQPVAPEPPGRTEASGVGADPATEVGPEAPGPDVGGA